MIVGTENREVLILEKSGMSVAKTLKLEGIPVFLATTGAFEVEYKIYVACRNGYTYCIKNGKVSSSFNIHIESRPLGLIKLDKTIVIAAMNRNIYSYYNKGRLNFTKQMPAEITDI
jgi:Bardet-Biedl syndrome 1 protein